MEAPPAAGNGIGLVAKSLPAACAGYAGRPARASVRNISISQSAGVIKSSHLTSYQSCRLLAGVPAGETVKEIRRTGGECFIGNKQRMAPGGCGGFRYSRSHKTPILFFYNFMKAKRSENAISISFLF